jgi:hypothetical protein
MDTWNALDDGHKATDEAGGPKNAPIFSSAERKSPDYDQASNIEVAIEWAHLGGD